MPVQPASTASCARYSSVSRPDRGGLDPQRHVLGDQADVAALGAQVQRDHHDPAVVAVVAEAGRQHRRVAVVELDVQRAAVLADRHRRVEPAVGHPQVVEDPQRLAGEPAQLGVVALVLQFTDHDEREHHVGVAEAQQRTGVGEQDGGVEDVRTASGHEFDSRGAHGTPPLEGGRAPAQRPGAGPPGRRTRQHQPGLPWTARAARHPLRTLGPPVTKVSPHPYRDPACPPKWVPTVPVTPAVPVTLSWTRGGTGARRTPSRAPPARRSARRPTTRPRCRSRRGRTRGRP